MKNTAQKFGLFAVLACFLAFGCTKPGPSESPRPILRAYTHDSFISKSGLGAWLKPEFEKLCNCELKFLSVGDGGQIAARLELDKARGKRDTDIVVGIDELSWIQARPHFESWGEWEPKNYGELTSAAKVEKGFCPYDYGVFSLIAETGVFEKKVIELPKKLTDLTSGSYRKRLVLEDPRTSTPGLAFLLLTHEVLGPAADDFWKKLKGSLLAMMPGWDSAYGLFMKGEAALVWSYTSSQAYHRSENQTNYKAIVFEEGNPVQVEGAAMITGIASEQRRIAEQFFDFLLTPEVQSQVFTKQWMYAVIKNTPQPASYAGVPRPLKVIHLDKTRDEVQAALKRFAEVVQ